MIAHDDWHFLQSFISVHKNRENIFLFPFSVVWILLVWKSKSLCSITACVLAGCVELCVGSMEFFSFYSLCWFCESVSGISGVKKSARDSWHTLTRIDGFFIEITVRWKTYLQILHKKTRMIFWKLINQVGVSRVQADPNPIEAKFLTQLRALAPVKGVNRLDMLKINRNFEKNNISKK